MANPPRPIQAPVQVARIQGYDEFEVRAQLAGLGWSVLVVWECRTEKADDLAALVARITAPSTA